MRFGPGGDRAVGVSAFAVGAGSAGGGLDGVRAGARRGGTPVEVTWSRRRADEARHAEEIRERMAQSAFARLLEARASGAGAPKLVALSGGRAT
jgi:hypothetical protein